MAYKNLIISFATLILVLIFILTTGIVQAADTVTSATVSSSTVVDKTPPTASSPTVMLPPTSDLCITTLTGAVQTSVFGLSGGTHVISEDCRLRRRARMLYSFGLKVAGVSLLCRTPDVFLSMLSAGTPCPCDDGKIGSEARKFWLANPDLAPEGARVQVRAIAERVKAVKLAAAVAKGLAQEEENPWND